MFKMLPFEKKILLPDTNNSDKLSNFLYKDTNMPGLLPNVDPKGLLEYSVVFTDRSLNHMSQSFQGVMNDISNTLKQV